MTTPDPSKVQTEALDRVFELMNASDNDERARLLDAAASNTNDARLVLAHAAGLLVGVVADHYPGGVERFQADVRAKFERHL